MFWNKTKTKIAEPEAIGSETDDKMLRYVRVLALHIMEEMRIDRHKLWLSKTDPRVLAETKGDKIEPAEAVLHLMALQIAATSYIALAPDPRLCLRNFVEVLEDEVVKACRGMGRRC
jgi:hypothetical protein